MMLQEAHLLRVFANATGKYGDLASIVIDEGKHIPDTKRQEITKQLGTGETVFINDIAKAEISIMHYDGEIDFAGVAALATSFYLNSLSGKPITTMHTKAGTIKTWQENDLTWVKANLSTMPPWNLKQLDSAEAIEQLSLADTNKLDHTLIWVWQDEAKALIRARTFSSDWGIPEAQGNGSGAMLLAAKLNRAIQIKHGRGSIIYAAPAEVNCVNLGGRVRKSNK